MLRTYEEFIKDLSGRSFENMYGKVSVTLADVVSASSMGLSPSLGSFQTATDVGTIVNHDAVARDGELNTSSWKQPPTGFKFGTASLKELDGVKHELVECSELALTKYSRIDFCCYDGIRTLKEQQQHMKDGTTKTMKSKHLDGLAVDLVPWINGKPTWDWNGCYEIARAMDAAATEFGFADHIRWGGAWDRVLSDFAGDAGAYKKAVDEYKARHPGPDFIDGPHFEWVS